MERIYCSQIDSPMGRWQVCATSHGVCSVLPGKGNGGEENAFSRKGAEELQAYFQGERKVFSVPLDLQGTKYQQEVWKALCSIPYGQTSTYGQLAKQMGKVGGAQAVGQALGKNPCLIIVPCHRILSADGSLGGYSQGTKLKKWLLELENGAR